MKISNRILCLIVTATLASALWAQNTLNDINRIKKDKEYLYGEATLDKKDAALSVAYELLKMEIKNWAAQQDPKIKKLIASDIKEYTDTIILKRHNMIRAFVYVKISNLVAINGKTMAVEMNQKSSEAVNPVAVSPTIIKTQPMPTPTPQTSRNEVIERLMDVKSFYDLEKVITPMKEEGTITDFGKYNTMTDPANSYLIIYDQEAKIVAILDKGVKVRHNFVTGKEDSEVNYHGCGAIWFKMK